MLYSLLFMKLKHFIFHLFVYILLMLPLNIIANSYTFTHLGVEDGLSNNYVLDIEQDGQGFIWIATESGLSRFDGRSFTTFEENTSGLITNALNVLLYDKEENRLWIGSKEGVSVLDCSTLQFENYESHNNVVLKNVVYISHASDGGIWLINHFGGITHYNKKTKQFSSFFDDTIKEAKYRHWSAYDDGNGTLYLGHSHSGLSIINLKTNTVRNYQNDPLNSKSLPGNRIYSICADSQQNIWLGTDHGLALFNPQTEDFLVFKHNPTNPNSLIADHIYCIREMNDGSLWIATDIGGISILDPKISRFVKPEEVRFINISATNDDKGLSSNNIRTLLQDSFGNIWIGNYSSGIDFITHSKPPFGVLPYTKTGKTPKNKPVWGMCKDKKGRIWLGSENEIAVFMENKLQKIVPITDYINKPYTQVFAITCDRNGLLWLGIYDDGLLTYHEPTNQFNRIQLGIENMDIITFYEDATGKMWIGAEYGVYSYMNGKATLEENIMSQLKDRAIYGILHDQQGKLWIGTYGSGVFLFDENEKLIANFWKENGFCSNSVSHLFMDSKGGVWVATRNGIAYIEDTTHPEKYYQHYGYQQRLIDTHVRAIHEDMSGNIWLSTNIGISLWDKKNNEFDNYDFRDGMPVGNFIEGSACSTADGIIYFGSLNGVSFFNPKELVIEHPVSPVQIIDCRAYNKHIENTSMEYIIPQADGCIKLPYEQNTFRISFAVPDYSQSHQVEYAYRMDGTENGWHPTQGENQITFRNLPPGEYLFQIKARLKNQKWDETHIASLSIQISPPLWGTWYARLFYLFIVCVGGFFILKTYKNRLNLKTSLELERKKSQNKQELNEERLRFYTNVTHELRTPLTLILGPLEDLIGAEDIPEARKNKIQTIHSSAFRLLNLINKILEFRKTETQNRKLTVQKGDIAYLIKEIGLRYKELNQNNKTDFHTRIETDDTVLYFDEDMITTILDNLLSNALKYTPEGEICLVLRSVEEKDNFYTEIEVSDTGYGIDKQVLPRIFDRYYQAKGKHQASGTGIGLALVKSLVELHEGILTVDSTLAEGTVFRIRLLTGNTYPNALHHDTYQKRESKKEERIDFFKEVEDDTLPIVLVIEDNDDIREYIVSSLSSNYIIHTAKNGKEGLEMAQKDIPNLIISDIMMPEMDGLELCRIVKSDIRTSHIPIILLTAKDSIKDKEEGYESGADSYLTKPFSAKLLISRIHNILESRRKIAEQVTTRAKSIKSKMTDKSQDLVKIGRMDEEFLTKITTLIEENLHMENLDISFLREKVNMSHSTFYRKIKALTGISANEFIRKVKIKNSLKLLLTGSYNISETAYMIGFSDVSYFSQCFKEEYGMLPSEYIRKVKTEENQERDR